PENTRAGYARHPGEGSVPAFISDTRPSEKNAGSAAAGWLGRLIGDEAAAELVEGAGRQAGGLEPAEGSAVTLVEVLERAGHHLFDGAQDAAEAGLEQVALLPVPPGADGLQQPVGIGRLVDVAVQDGRPIDAEEVLEQGSQEPGAVLAGRASEGHRLGLGDGRRGPDEGRG